MISNLTFMEYKNHTELLMELYSNYNYTDPNIRVCNSISIFSFLNQNIRCVYLKEPYQWETKTYVKTDW